jgi:hypothetical protein
MTMPGLNLDKLVQRIVLDIDLRWIQDGAIWGGPFTLYDWLTSRGVGVGHACPALCPCGRTVTASPLSWRACGHQLGPATAAGSGAFLFWPAGLARRAVSDRPPSRGGGLTSGLPRAIGAISVSRFKSVSYHGDRHWQAGPRRCGSLQGQELLLRIIIDGHFNEERRIDSSYHVFDIGPAPHDHRCSNVMLGRVVGRRKDKTPLSRLPVGCSLGFVLSNSIIPRDHNPRFSVFSKRRDPFKRTSLPALTAIRRSASAGV